MYVWMDGFRAPSDARATARPSPAHVFYVLFVPPTTPAVLASMIFLEIHALSRQDTQNHKIQQFCKGNHSCLTTVLAGMIFSEIHPLNRQSSQKH